MHEIEHPVLVVQDFQTYLTFCAIGLINAQMFDQSFALSRRLQVRVFRRPGFDCV